MPNYERGRDRLIAETDKETFSMKDAAKSWFRRAESFDSLQGYTIFARRMELCLRTVLGAPIEGREGLGALAKDLSTFPSRFKPIKDRLKIDVSSLIEGATLADCGAGTGSILSFIEWAGLPYPNQLVLLEPNSEYFSFLKRRIEGEEDTQTRDRIVVIGKETHNRHNKVEHVVYVIEDRQTGNHSQVQVMNSSLQQQGTLPLIAKTEGIVIIGLSKYFSPDEFRLLVSDAQLKFQGREGGITVFNTQGRTDLLQQKASSSEMAAYKGLKMLHQVFVSGRPTLHNFYGKDDIDSFTGVNSVVHNYGCAIVVGLNTSI